MINDAAPSAQRVLVIDDEKTMLMAISRLLTRHGFEVDCASSGPEALSRFQKGRWDIVLTDLLMPGMRGDVLATMLRTIDPVVPILLVSGSVDLAAATVPFAGIVRKPFSVEMLLEAIRQVTHARTVPSHAG